MRMMLFLCGPRTPTRSLMNVPLKRSLETAARRILTLHESIWPRSYANEIFILTERSKLFNICILSQRKQARFYVKRFHDAVYQSLRRRDTRLQKQMLTESSSLCNEVDISRYPNWTRRRWKLIYTHKETPRSTLHTNGFIQCASSQTSSLSTDRVYSLVVASCMGTCSHDADRLTTPSTFVDHL